MVVFPWGVVSLCYSTVDAYQDWFGFVSSVGTIGTAGAATPAPGVRTSRLYNHNRPWVFRPAPSTYVYSLTGRRGGSYDAAGYSLTYDLSPIATGNATFAKIARQEVLDDFVFLQNQQWLGPASRSLSVELVLEHAISKKTVSVIIFFELSSML